jgi:transcription antitermination factor NusG
MRSAEEHRVVPDRPAEDVAKIAEDQTAWYAVHVKRCSEGRVVHHLTMKSIPTFLPLIESVRRLNGAGKLTRLEPLFPGYLFVRMGPLESSPGSWHAVRWSPGVRRILGAEATPVPMPDEAIEAMQTRVLDLGFVRPGLRFASGTRVRMRYGLFAGLEAVFDRPMSRSGRVRVLLELLGEVRRLELDELDIESA